MRWPRRHQPTTDPKAEAALAIAEQQFAEQHALGPQIDSLTARLVERRKQNRFAELVEHALQARQGPT